MPDTAFTLLPDSLRRRFVELGEQDDTDDSKVIVAAHYFLPGAAWDWYAVALFDGLLFAGPGDAFFGLVKGLDMEFGYFSLAELESARSPLGTRVERDLYWRECSLRELKAKINYPY